MRRRAAAKRAIKASTPLSSIPRPSPVALDPSRGTPQSPRLSSPSSPAHSPMPAPPPRLPASPAVCDSFPPPPRGVIIPGGRPVRGLVDCGPGYPLPPDEFAASPFGKWQANVEAMLAALAAKNDAQEQRIAALEKTVAFNEAARQTVKSLARAIGELIGVRLP